jgi:DNA-binding NtrC family response regulator
MKSPLHILYLEDDPRDAELVQQTLAMNNISSFMTRVETEADFIASLKQGGFDLILADYTLPSFDGMSALKIAQWDCPHVPIIFVSGTLGEEVAIEALKVGATDYVFKTRLARIVPSVQRALREADERIGLSRAEQALRRSEAYLVFSKPCIHWKLLRRSAGFTPGKSAFRLPSLLTLPSTLVTKGSLNQPPEPCTD